MVVNISKTKYIIFRPKGMQIDLQGKEVLFNNNEIGQPDLPEQIFKWERCHNANPDKEHRTYKLLGVIFDQTSFPFTKISTKSLQKYPNTILS